MEQLFKIGDVVTLKSGGEKMTIVNDKIGIDLTLGSGFNDKYECSWFENNKLKFDDFPQEALIKI